MGSLEFGSWQNRCSNCSHRDAMLLNLIKISELYVCDVLMKRKKLLARIIGRQWLWCSVNLEIKMTNTDLHERIPKFSESVCLMIVNRKTPKSSIFSLTLEEKCSIVILSLIENETFKNPKTFPCHAYFVPPKITNW